MNITGGRVAVTRILVPNDGQGDLNTPAAAAAQRLRRSGTAQTAGKTGTLCKNITTKNVSIVEVSNIKLVSCLCRGGYFLLPNRE